MAERFQLFNAPPNDGVYTLQTPLFGPNGVAWETKQRVMKSTVPLGPFTGYAAILKRSCFLKPAQQLMDDLFGSAFRVTTHPIGGETLHDSCDRVGYGVNNNPRLVFMLQEVYKRCKLYCQQIQSVVTSFETVAGLANAAPFISHAIRAISTHFGCLKNVILSCLRFEDHREAPRLSWAATDNHGPLRNLSSPRWRSHRGLPERSVALLKNWLFQHFLHPYPSDSEKQMLAQQTGLSRTQVSNWFINSRVRLWKPMIEEIHDLQTQENQVLPETTSTNKRSRYDCHNVKKNNDYSDVVDSVGNGTITFTSETEASLALDLQPNIGLGPSLAFSRPIIQTIDVVPSGEASFKNWF